MNRICLTGLFITILLPAICQPRADTIDLKFPDETVLPGKFSKAIKKQENEFDRLFCKDSNILKSNTARFILDKIDHDSNYKYLFIVEYSIAFHYKEIIPQLIKRITDKTEVGLVNTADLIIWERIKTGQLKFYGHGGISNDDLFTVAGRANRLLKLITGEDFGNVSMKSDQSYLKSLQNKWIRWLRLL